MCRWPSVVGSLWILISVVISPSLLSACNKPLPQEIVQCIAKTTGENPQLPREALSLLKFDEQRKCYALRWKVDPQLAVKQHEPDRLTLKQEIAEIAPDAKLLDGSSFVLARDVEIYPSDFLPFQLRATTLKGAYEAAYGVKPNGKSMHGLTVYEATKALDVAHEALFYPKSKEQPVVACGVTGGKRIEEMQGRSVCQVWANVDDLIWIKYRISYDSLHHIASINEAVAQRLRGLMLM